MSWFWLLPILFSSLTAAAITVAIVLLPLVLLSAAASAAASDADVINVGSANYRV